MAVRDTEARDVAALALAGVVVAKTVAGEVDRRLADQALEPETVDVAGIDQEFLVEPVDTGLVAVIEARHLDGRS